RVLDRALLAFHKGLAGKARDLLLESDVAAFGAQGMLLELELLLRTGRAKEVRDWLSPEHKAALGAASYHWLRAQALAASGGYALAEKECEQLTLDGRGRAGASAYQGMALLLGQAVLDEQPAVASWADVPRRALSQVKVHNGLADLANALSREANA